MSDFVPNHFHLLEVFILFFHSKRAADKAHFQLRKRYGDANLKKETCLIWFRRFKHVYYEVDDRWHEGSRNLLKTLNWRHCSMKFVAKQKTSLLQHYQVLFNPFPSDLICSEWFISRNLNSLRVEAERGWLWFIRLRTTAPLEKKKYFAPWHHFRW